MVYGGHTEITDKSAITTSTKPPPTFGSSPATFSNLWAEDTRIRDPKVI